MITLTDGRQVNAASILFDTGTYHFTLNGEDITNLITRADKLANWPEFDPTVDNTRASNEARGGSGPVAQLPTDTLGILADQLATDPLSAPINAAKSELSKAFNDLTGGSTIAKVAVIAGTGLLIFLLIKE